MTTLYTGDSDNVSDALSRTVTAASFATPIVITTSVDHLFSDNDYVTISGVTGNLAANGSWRITYVDTTHFSLDGSVGTGAYVAGGTVVDRSLTPSLIEPVDGELRSVASVEMMTRALADRTQFLSLRGPLQADTLTTAAFGTWKCPPGVTQVWLCACGGGGGGGGGTGGTTTATTTSAPGGGAGGGSPMTWSVQTVVAGTTYNYALGGGGAGGAAGAAGGGAGVLGSDGAGSSFNSIVVARGASGGQTATGVLTSATLAGYVPGGVPTRPATVAIPGERYKHASNAGLADPSYPHQGGQGGVGSSAIGQFATEGGACLQGHLGGVLGGLGAASGAQKGGGGGGGGGAGAFGTGGTGGIGGAGNNAGNGAAGSSGGTAAANSGGGGGGGGGGGQGSIAGGQGGPGTVGATGKIIVFYSGEKAYFT